MRALSLHNLDSYSKDAASSAAHGSVTEIEGRREIMEPGPVLKTVRWVEGGFDHVFGSRDNPLRHLGALGFYFFWVMAGSGIYLYALFDTSVTGAYASVEYLTREQWYLGGIARSLHRYAADAFVIVVLLHLLKETVNRRFNGFRFFSWITGVPLLWLMYASGIGGYWLVWDRVAQLSATATAEWLDWLPLFGEPLARNFLAPGAVSDRFFSLLSFLHIGIPLLLLLGMWVHIQRVSLADVAPPRRLGWATFAVLLGVGFIHPAVSESPADLAILPASVPIDWFYLFVHPLMYATSPATLWLFAGLATLLLLLAPLLSQPKRAPVAEVSPQNCNGCGRCVADCPFMAVSLVAHPTKARRMLARVNADLCASCGICAGACPSSTPFRRMTALESGIDMPRLTVAELRQRLENALDKGASTIVFGCDCAADVSKIAGNKIAVFSLPCIGNLPPAFIEYALRNGADGVLVTGCRDGDCAFRFGNLWMQERISGEREPHLRPHVSRDRIALLWANAGEEKHLAAGLAAFRGRMARNARPSHTPAGRRGHA